MKDELIEMQGWKVLDLMDTERVHVSAMLERLPDRKYTNVEEVLGTDVFGCCEAQGL